MKLKVLDKDQNVLFEVSVPPGNCYKGLAIRKSILSAANKLTNRRLYVIVHAETGAGLVPFQFTSKGRAMEVMRKLGDTYDWKSFNLDVYHNLTHQEKGALDQIIFDALFGVYNNVDKEVCANG